MGYYIPNDKRLSQRGAELTGKPKSLDEIAEDKALLCEVDNGPFFANALIYNQRELEDFTIPSDRRTKRWFLMDKEEAYKLSGYN